MGSLCCRDKNLRDPSTVSVTKIEQNPSPKVENLPLPSNPRRGTDGSVTESSVFGESGKPRVTYVPNMRNFKSLKKIDDITAVYTLGKHLGQGNFGSVDKAVRVGASKEIALK